METQVGSGIVTGAWGYVTAVYVANWLVVVGLSLRAFLASRNAPNPTDPAPGGSP